MRGKLVLDCSTRLPGPFLAQLLAREGARVVQFESPAVQDDSDRLGYSSSFLRSGKEQISMDLGNPLHRDEFYGWVRKADAVIEGFRPETRARLGLDWQSLQSVNPRICVVSVTGHEEKSDRNGRAGHDLNFQALSGALSLTHELPGMPLSAVIGAYSGAYRLASALHDVSRDGKGRRVEVSLLKTLREAQLPFYTRFIESGALPVPGSTLVTGKFPCYGIYRTSDGRRVSVAATERKFWVKLCEILGTQGLAAIPYAEGPEAQEAKRLIQAAFSSKTWKEWEPLFREGDCCVEPILDYSEIPEEDRGVQP